MAGQSRWDRPIRAGISTAGTTRGRATAVTGSRLSLFSAPPTRPDQAGDSYDHTGQSYDEQDDSQRQRLDDSVQCDDPLVLTRWELDDAETPRNRLTPPASTVARPRKSRHSTVGRRHHTMTMGSCNRFVVIPLSPVRPPPFMPGTRCYSPDWYIPLSVMSRWASGGSALHFVETPRGSLRRGSAGRPRRPG